MVDADQWHYLDDTLALIESGRQRAAVRQVVDAWRGADQRSVPLLMRARAVTVERVY